MKAFSGFILGGTTAFLAACAPVPAQSPDPGPANASAAGDTTIARTAPESGGTDGLIPSGLGTLRQEEITVSLRSDALLIKVTPLAESVIRLTAPDTYGRLHGLAESRRARAERAVADPELALVSFFSYEPDVIFQPDDLELVYRGQILRPITILPITSGWGSQRLRQGETQNAIYVFRQEIDYDIRALVVRYGSERSDAWSRIVPRLQTERSRVLTQVKS